MLGFCLGACTINLASATVLELGVGTVVESYEFEARDPTEWSFSVEVMALIGTMVEVTFLTTNGATLHIFQTPSDPYEAGASRSPGVSGMLGELPAT